MTVNPIVVDISHYQSVRDWNAVKRAGIVGVIHKATEGLTGVDDKYATHRTGAEAAGILWGAYHFLRPGNIAAQVRHFLAMARPTSATLLALDHEDARVPLADAKEFLRLIRATVDRDAILYSGNLIKEQLGSHVDADLAKIRLWLAQYGNSPTTQATWPKPWLWQFTDGHVGPQPHTIPGIDGAGLDIDSYSDTPAQLRREWTGSRTLPMPPPPDMPAPPRPVPPVDAPISPLRPATSLTPAQKGAGAAVAAGTAVVGAAGSGVPWGWIIGVGFVALAGFILWYFRKDIAGLFGKEG